MLRASRQALNGASILTSRRGLASASKEVAKANDTKSDVLSEKQEEGKVQSKAISEDEKADRPRKKTVKEMDEELMAKLEGRSGDGGAAGLELENGKPVAMKRGVKNNMFRLI